MFQPGSWWRDSNDTDLGSILRLDLAPRAFDMVVTGYSTGHPPRLLAFFTQWCDSGDNRAVNLEFPIPVARPEKGHVVWYPSWSGVGYILPDLRI